MNVLKSIKENFGIMPILVTGILMSNMVGGIPHLPQEVNYVAYILGALYLLIDKVKLNKIWLGFIFYVPLSIALASPDPVFRSWLRYGLFAIMYVVATGLVNTERARRFRSQSLNLILWFCVIMSIGSFFAYFMGINYFVDRFEGGYITDYEGRAGQFSGLMTHSMLLGPASGIAMVYLYNLMSKTNKRWIWFLIVISAGTALLSSSRAALVAALFSFTVSIYKTSTNKGQFVKKSILIVVLAVVSFPLWQEATTAVVSKQTERQEVVGGVFDSRNDKMVYRWSEFTSSPIWGIGFSAVDTNKDVYNSLTGTIEPGTSWLAILSMTGIVGFILLVRVFISSIKACKNDPQGFLYIGILAFFSMHGLVEGYIFAASNPVCYMLWLVLGCTYDIPNLKNKEIVL